ncbi:M10 family metallopeptidase [Maritimibacter sp. UBA3975]|uniref:M10 family metallopeptidase n=1 Tax=Maritimibacter sp. UBA3975 TaxID=1946833 RepID=UPI000C09044C|nr:M10 family metallopeptidase [Maritimibacter sp. UBA3975]MAM62173.1 hypothetical protein [Maritimibacter sp.]|tara:strand:+ start:154 stop:1944 length:1791 start_codon:yes stop_codon:yes gene_type:complete
MFPLSEQEILDGLLIPSVTPFVPMNGDGDARYTLTYQFAGAAPPADDLDNGYTGWTAYTETEKNVIRAALEHIETFLNVDFDEVTGVPDPDFHFGLSDPAPETWAGSANTSVRRVGGTVQWDAQIMFDRNMDLTGFFGMSTALHEIAHGLGLDHPGNSIAAYDDMHHTIMSYNLDPALSPGVETSAMMYLDVFALQHIWGAVASNTGDTTYTGPVTNTTGTTTVTDTIWDTGGYDILDASAQSNAVTLDLREGYYSSMGGVYEDVAIAFGTVIEQANGGTNADTLVAHEAGSTLSGGAGADTYELGDGRDRVFDSWANLDGDQINNFGFGDQILIYNMRFGMPFQTGDDLDVVNGSGSAVMTFTANGLPTIEINFDTEFSFSPVLLGFNGRDSVITHLPRSPEKGEGIAIESGTNNGRVESSFLLGENADSFNLFAGYESLTSTRGFLGYYEVTPNGTIVDVGIAYDDTSTTFNNPYTTIDGVDADNELAFFYARDGADLAMSLSQTDELKFVDGDGGLANVSDGPYVYFEVNGSMVWLEMFHSYSATMNRDGKEHTATSAFDSNQLVIAFEDQRDLGDADFQDVVLYVSPSYDFT